MEWSWAIFGYGFAAGSVIGFGVGFVAVGILLGLVEDRDND